MHTNPFALFSLPTVFDLDAAALERQYFALQRQHHPDRLAGKPAMERAAAAQMSARVNDAYQTLRSPVKRAQCLLALQGITIGTERDTVKPGQDILMETLMWREEAADIPPGGQEAFRARLTQARDAAFTALSQAFRENRPDEAAQAALRLMYLEKTLEETARMR